MTLQEGLAQMPDPRRAEGRRYELTPLLIGTLLALACGATSSRKGHRFLAAHGQRLIAVFGGPGKRAPAYPTVRKGLRELDSEAREAAFRPPRQGRRAVHGEGAGGGIAIDGKGLRGSFDPFADRRAAHLLGTLAQTERLMLAPVPRADHSHEIPAAPGHDLRVQVKGHQPTLRRAVAHLTPRATACEVHTRTDLDRRRPTQRTVRGFAAQDLPAPGAGHLAAVVQVQRLTDAFSTNAGRGRGARETRYYVGSRFASAAVLAQAIRGHGGIENRLHYVKDVTLQEEASRIRQTPGLFAWLRSFALNLLRAHGETHISLATYDNALNLDRALQYVGVLR